MIALLLIGYRTDCGLAGIFPSATRGGVEKLEKRSNEL